jgi:hypothetical protein
MPNLGTISRYGLFLFGLGVVLNIVLFLIALVR